MQLNKKPELLAPAGDLEKLKVAVLYGADAVYAGGHAFGLRAQAKNFDMEDLAKGVEFAHNYGRRVYITANIIAHNNDFDDMAEYFTELEKIGVDALIISDMGVFSVAREVTPNLEIHVSTQANVTNYRSCLQWEQLGAKRVVLARELSLTEINEIKEKVSSTFMLETFVHGAMCMSYSGRCLLSSYLTGRDSNKGDCAQPCRWKYNLVEEKRTKDYMPIIECEKGTYIFNSKDLCMIQNLPDLISAGINSLKIEGRMKTAYYVGTIVKAYRGAIDDYFESPQLFESRKEYYFEEVSKTSHRHYTTGFYYNKADSSSQVYDSSSYIRTYDFIGIVLDYESGFAIIEQRNKFKTGDIIEFVKCKGENFSQVINAIYDQEGNEILEAPHPKQILKIKIEQPVQMFDMLRRKTEEVL